MKKNKWSSFYPDYFGLCFICILIIMSSMLYNKPQDQIETIVENETDQSILHEWRELNEKILKLKN